MENNVIIKSRCRCRNTERNHLVIKLHFALFILRRKKKSRVSYYMHQKKDSHDISKQTQHTVTKIKWYKYIFTPVIALKCIIHFRSSKRRLEWAI